MKRIPIFGEAGSAASATREAAGASQSSAKPRRRSAALAAVLSLSLLAAACSSGDSGGGSSTLTVQVQAEQLKSFQYAADIFEKKNPGVKVKLQTITGEQKNSTNAQVLASGDAPDIGIVPTNAPPYLELMKNNGARPSRRRVEVGRSGQPDGQGDRRVDQE